MSDELQKMNQKLQIQLRGASAHLHAHKQMLNEANEAMLTQRANFIMFQAANAETAQNLEIANKQVESLHKELAECKDKIQKLEADLMASKVEPVQPVEHDESGACL